MSDDVLPLTPDDVRAMTAATAAGEVVLFPAETVYGLAADPSRPEAVTRMAALKDRDPGKPSSVLFWSLDAALAALRDAVPAAVLAALPRLLPGPVGVLLPNPGGAFPAAAGDAPGTLGVRVPRLAQPVDAPPVVQTSANRAGGPDPATLDAVPPAIRAAARLVRDAGPRPGRPSTIVDLRRAHEGAGWDLVREGAVPRTAIAARLDGVLPPA